MSEFNLSEKYRSAQVLETFLPLVVLYNLQTQHLESVQPPHADVQTLQDIATEMDKLLLQVAHRVQSLREIVTQHPNLSEQAYEKALASSTLTNKQKTKFKSLVGRAGGFLAFARDATKGLEEAIPDARKQLASDLESISHGVIQPFLRKAFWCDVAAGIMIGGVFTQNPFAFGFGLGFAIGLDC